jgi:hypothetical protein
MKTSDLVVKGKATTERIGVSARRMPPVGAAVRWSGGWMKE